MGTNCLIEDFYRTEIVDQKEQYYFDEEKYYSMPTELYNSSYKGSIADAFTNAIDLLPLNDHSGVLGLGKNAEISKSNMNSDDFMAFATESISIDNPTTSQKDEVGTKVSNDSDNKEDSVQVFLSRLLDHLPDLIDISELKKSHPINYFESLNTVLQQECIKYNRLLGIVRLDLQNLSKALKGQVITNERLEKIFFSIDLNKTPEEWLSSGYSSLKPLNSWFENLKERVEFFTNWANLPNSGAPQIFWLSGFFFPQAFLTAILQNHARKRKIAIDELWFDFKVIPKDSSIEDFRSQNEDATFIEGLFMEGAVWNCEKECIDESCDENLYSELPRMAIIPSLQKNLEATGSDCENVYKCPVYKTLTRAGTLSTTGHSTNFVFNIDLKCSKTPKHWTKRGAALFCALKN